MIKKIDNVRNKFFASLVVYLFLAFLYSYFLFDPFLRLYCLWWIRYLGW